MNLTDIFLNKLKIDTKQVPIDSLFNDEGKVKKTLYDPPYQRNYVWDGEKATYFLESIMIGTEIPPLIFFKSGLKLEIIDGRQRYETILKFLRGEIRLKKSGLKKLDVLDIEKKSFFDLSLDMQNDFLETKLRVIEFSFASRDGLTQADEDSVKQEIFKRYNSGITPLKEFEIDKAIYFEDDLNAFFKDKLKEGKFHDLFTTLFRYEDKRVEISLKKIRQLLVLHRIPIKYYSIAKQKVTDKYYDLLSSQMKVDDIDEFYDSFYKKLVLIDCIRAMLESIELPYNRLISEVLFWAFSIMEENEVVLPKESAEAVAGFADVIQRHIHAFKMDRSSFANEIVTRYQIIADYLTEAYGISTKPYIVTSADFIQQNREMSQQKESETVNYQELRIHKPEPTTDTIDDICRQMKRNRFLVRPAYQREEVINKRKSSEIIESLLLGIKLPPIFVFKNEDGVCEVIDGQQRILSILAFLGREYMNENGQMVKTKKDKFSLQLKDSILTDLNGKRFDQLTEEQQDTITSFGLWVIEINHKYNPSFESLDLFIRLNYKPCPIKDDTFEMWNSYIDRGLINTIKVSYANNANWFFLRKNGTRMENENNYTVLSYFKYLELHPEEGSDKGPLDIYKVGGRIAFRLRSKGDISKILENVDKKDAFAEAVNTFEFTFVAKLKMLLSDDKDDSEKSLSKSLDELLGVENGKRTQQSFYVLWYFLRGLDSKSLSYYRKQIRREVRQLFSAMTLDITVEEFNERVNKFREQYVLSEEPTLLFARVGDVTDIVSFDSESPRENEGFDYYVLRDNKKLNRVQLIEIPPMYLDEYYGIRVNRVGFIRGYIASVLQSSLVFNEYDFSNRNVTASSLKGVRIPVLPLAEQQVFDKMLEYTYTTDKIQRSFFENVLDRMVEEVFHQDLFRYHNVSLFEKVRRLDDLRGIDVRQRYEQIEKAYHAIIMDKEGLFAELSEATGITSSLNYEKDK
jgi:uncharacterized protein with ParB-like and HNH nuclease domain